MRKCYKNVRPMSSLYNHYFVVVQNERYGYETFIFLDADYGRYVYQDEYVPYDLEVSGKNVCEKIVEHCKIEEFNALPFEIQIAKCLAGCGCSLADCIEIKDESLIDEIMGGI